MTPMFSETIDLPVQCMIKSHRRELEPNVVLAEKREEEAAAALHYRGRRRRSTAGHTHRGTDWDWDGNAPEHTAQSAPPAAPGWRARGRARGPGLIDQPRRRLGSCGPSTRACGGAQRGRDRGGAHGGEGNLATGTRAYASSSARPGRRDVGERNVYR